MTSQHPGHICKGFGTDFGVGSLRVVGCVRGEIYVFYFAQTVICGHGLARYRVDSGAGVVTLARAGKGSGSTITVQIQPTSRGHTATPELNAITACR